VERCLFEGFFSTKLLQAYFQYLLYWNLNLIGFKLNPIQFNEIHIQCIGIKFKDLNSIHIQCIGIKFKDLNSIHIQCIRIKFQNLNSIQFKLQLEAKSFLESCYFFVTCKILETKCGELIFFPLLLWNLF
jgi:hypothetical protein